MSKALKSGKSQTQEIDGSRKPANPRRSQNQKIEKSQNPGNHESPKIRKPINLKKNRESEKLTNSENRKMSKSRRYEILESHRLLKPEGAQIHQLDFYRGPETHKRWNPQTRKTQKPRTCKKPDNHKCPEYEHVHLRIPGRRHSTKWWYTLFYVMLSYTSATAAPWVQTSPLRFPSPHM